MAKKKIPGSGRGLHRRQFLKAAALSAFAGPLVGSFPVRGAEAPSNKTTVGCIGVGNRGGGLLQEVAAQDTVKVVAICDVFRQRRENATRWVNEQAGSKICTPYRDLREMLARDDIDAVVIATPDHWHVPAALMAVRSGKDIYVEKPLGLSLEENVTLREEVKRHARVMQYGTQQRSLAHVRHGAELVRNGYIGKIESVTVTAPSYGFEGGSLEPVPVPDGLDYELWLGPAPWRPYTKDRCTEWGAYWCSDNAHGFIGGWGAHPLTDMVWALGDSAEDSVPIECSGTGKFGKGLFDAPYDWDIRGQFRRGATFHFTPGGDCVTLIGDKGKVSISRGGLVTEPLSLKNVRLGPNEIRLEESSNHMGNYIECVRNRRRPVAPIDVAVLSDSITQLSMIALWTGRKIHWDACSETIVNDSAAQALFRRSLRAPWHL